MKLKALILCLLAACSLTAFGQGLVSKTDTQWEIETGREAYEELISSARISKNEASRRRVQRILDQLVSALPEKLYPFQAVVIADNAVNAGCLPGGYMVVNEGLLVFMPDDCALAFTLGHELGHAIKRHAVRKLRKMQSAAATAAFISILTRTQVDDRQLALQGLAFTRSNEREADAFGTELYLRAGFDPAKVTEGMGLLEQVEKKGGGRQVPLYLRSHPYAEDRFAAIGQLADKLLANGLKPYDVNAPDLSLEQIFGKIPVLAATNSDWFSYKPGLELTYDVVPLEGVSSQYKVRCTGAATVGGTEVLHMEMQLTATPIQYQLIADGERLWRRNRIENPGSAWAMDAAIPDEGSVLEVNGGTVEYVGKETVDVPAGHFVDCTEVKKTLTDQRVLYEWYAPGVGLVRRANRKSGVSEVLAAIKRP